MGYREVDIPQVGGIKELISRINAKLAAIEQAQDTTALHAVEVRGNSVKFYTTTDTSLTPAYSFDFPVDKFLDQINTRIVEEFAWSSEMYPNSENPNMEGKTVMVFAVKDSGQTPTINYSFLDMSKLADVYTASDTSMTISGYNVKVNISTSANNAITLKNDGLHVDISGKLDKLTTFTTGNIIVAGQNGVVEDGGFKVATDAEFTEMLDEVFPTVRGGGA